MPKDLYIWCRVLPGNKMQSQEISFSSDLHSEHVKLFKWMLKGLVLGVKVDVCWWREERKARERKMTSWVTGWRAGRVPGFSQTVVKLSRSWRIPVLPSGFSRSFVLALPTGTDGIRILCHYYSRLEYNRAKQSCKVRGHREPLTLQLTNYLFFCRNIQYASHLQLHTYKAAHCKHTVWCWPLSSFTEAVVVLR